ncbi:hypothetical protein RRG08_003555 [Elysia crispata]|uniref:Uncharacterized protein n=1 Tax=Elysia crispata TaxID=231223 RepID=A0AAE1CTL9_9GAST|nr:hypothetical protein RRG08_003555 [Elysia crispata]
MDGRTPQIHSGYPPFDSGLVKGRSMSKMKSKGFFAINGKLEEMKSLKELTLSSTMSGEPLLHHRYIPGTRDPLHQHQARRHNQAGGDGPELERGL